MNRLLTFASFAEIATGLALLLDPRLVVALLIGPGAGGLEIPLGRVTGIALLAFGVACWPRGRHAGRGSPAFWGMLIYNVLIAVYLTYLSKIGHLGGVLLWPAVALHGVVALLLVWIWRGDRERMENRG